MLTDDIHEAISDPSVHPAVDDRVEAGVRDGQDVDHGEDIGKGGTHHHPGKYQTQDLDTSTRTQSQSSRVKKKEEPFEMDGYRFQPWWEKHFEPRTARQRKSKQWTNGTKRVDPRDLFVPSNNS